MSFSIIKLTKNRGYLVSADDLPPHSRIVCTQNPPTGMGFTSRCLEEALSNLSDWSVSFEEAKMWIEEYNNNLPENQIEEVISV